MKFIFLIIAFLPMISYSAQFVENKRLGFGQRVLMRGVDFLSMCNGTIDKINNKEKLNVNNCLLYVEGLRSGYGKATTEVLARAALFHVGDGDPKKPENWEKALSSKFYTNLSNAVSHCELSASTASLTKKLYDFIIANNLKKDVLTSIYFHFLEKTYPNPCN